MFGLVRFELIKILKQRFFIAAISLIMLAAFVITAYQARSEEIIPCGVIDEFYALYKSDPEALKKDYAEMNAFFDEQEQLWMQADALGENYVMLPWADRYSDSDKYGDMLLFSTLFSDERFAATGYYESIKKICDNARLSILQNESVSPNSFAKKYQTKVIQIYENLYHKVQIRLSHPTGWQTWFDMSGRQALLYAALIITAVCTYAFESDGQQLLRISKYGRRSTGIAKLVSLSVVAIALSLVFGTVTLTSVSLACGGMGDAGNAIQAVGGFEYVPFALTIWQSALLLILVQSLAAICFAALCAVICTAIPHVLPGIFGGLMLWGLNYLVFSGHVKLLQADLITYGSGKLLFDRYRVINIGGEPVSLLMTVSMLLAGVIILGGIFALFVFARRIGRTARKTPIKYDFTKLRQRVPGKVRFSKEKPIGRRRRYPRSLISFERDKIIKRKGVLGGIAVILLISGACINASVVPSASLSEQIYREYTETCAGVSTKEKIERIAEEIGGYEEVIALKETNQALYDSGKLSTDAYKVYLSKLYAATTRINAAKTVAARLERLYGTKGEIIYDSGIICLLTLPYRFAEAMLPILSGCLLYSSEFGGTRGFSDVLRTAKYGRKKTFLSKAALLILFCVFFSVLGAACEFFTVTARCGMPDVFVPIGSIDGYGGSAPIWAVILLRLCFETVSEIILAFVAMGLYVLYKHSVLPTMISVSAVLLPHFLSEAGLPVFEMLDIASVSDFGSSVFLSPTIYITLTIWLTVAGGLFFAAYRHYSSGVSS